MRSGTSVSRFPLAYTFVFPSLWPPHFVTPGMTKLRASDWSPYSVTPAPEPGSRPSALQLSTTPDSAGGGSGCRIKSGMTRFKAGDKSRYRVTGSGTRYFVTPAPEPGSNTSFMPTRNPIHLLRDAVRSGTRREFLARQVAHIRRVSDNRWGSSRAGGGRRPAGGGLVSA